MYLLILLLPLLGFIFTISFARLIGLGSFLISTGAVGITWLLSILAFYEVVYNYSTVYIDLGHWINLNHIQIGWSFVFDSITVSMLFIITFISFLVHLYSIYYMYHDKHYPRFMAYLSLFTFFMILLVTSNSLLLLFFGWEGVGLVSYFLINFWFTRILANKAAFKAFLINKLGDVFLLVGIIALTIYFGSMDIEIIFSLFEFNHPQIGSTQLHTHLTAPTVYNTTVDGPSAMGTRFVQTAAVEAVAIAILIGIMSKSAQFGLHVWLPDAMEGV